MRDLAILLLLFGISQAACAAKLVTLDQVDRLLISARHQSDRKLADKLFDMELTERVSPARLARWETELAGPKSRQAMVELADASEFLHLPPAEIPDIPAPDRVHQDALLTLTRNYVTQTIPKLPNFFATRIITRFSDKPEKIDSLTLVNAQFQQMHLVGTSSDKVYFREGKEVVVAENGKPPAFSGRELATQGVFGVAMELVLSDVLPTGPSWDHWEGSSDGPVAIFRYAVHIEKSHYAVKVEDDPRPTPLPVAYHGEVAIDPVDGTIRRLTAVAELSESSPISKADVVVDYGPVEIGGTSYICPVKSVSLAMMQTFNTTPNLQDRFRPSLKDGLPLTKVNDEQFTEYHRFRAELRIVSEGNDPSGPQ